MQNSNTTNTQIDTSPGRSQSKILKNLLILSLKNIIRNNYREQPMFKQIYNKLNQQSHLPDVEILNLFKKKSLRLLTQEYLIGFTIIQDIFECSQIQNKKEHIDHVKTLYILSCQVDENIQ